MSSSIASRNRREHAAPSNPRLQRPAAGEALTGTACTVLTPGAAAAEPPSRWASAEVS
jgi:hypothetical protein